MLKIRYNIITGQLTAWRFAKDGEKFLKIDRGWDIEAITTLDISIPDKPPMAWLYDGQKLIPNPDYVEPAPPRNLLAEIDDLKVKIKALEEI